MSGQQGQAADQLVDAVAGPDQAECRVLDLLRVRAGQLAELVVVDAGALRVGRHVGQEQARRGGRPLAWR